MSTPLPCSPYRWLCSSKNRPEPWCGCQSAFRDFFRIDHDALLSLSMMNPVGRKMKSLKQEQGRDLGDTVGGGLGLQGTRSFGSGIKIEILEIRDAMFR